MSRRGRSKTKDPNDIDEDALPQRGRGRSKTKDPNDVEDVPAPSVDRMPPTDQLDQDAEEREEVAVPVHFQNEEEDLMESRPATDSEAHTREDDAFTMGRRTSNTSAVHFQDEEDDDYKSGASNDQMEHTLTSRESKESRDSYVHFAMDEEKQEDEEEDEEPFQPGAFMRRMASRISTIPSMSSSGGFGFAEDRDRGTLLEALETPRAAQFQMTYCDEALLSKYRSEYNKGIQDSFVQVEDDPFADESGLSQRLGSTRGSSRSSHASALRRAGMADRADDSAGIHRYSPEMIIEDVGDSGEERHNEQQERMYEVNPLPGTMLAVHKNAMMDPRMRSPKSPSTRTSTPSLGRTNSEITSTTSIESPASSEDEWRDEVRDSALVDQRALDLENFDDEDNKGLVEVNNIGILCGFTFMYYWAAMAAGTLFASVWQYIFEDSKDLAQLAAGSAVKHTKVYLAEVLEPAVATMRMLDLAFRSGVVTSRLDYRGIERVLAPHFLLQPSLLEVELVDPPESLTSAGRGSLFVSRASSGSGLLELTTRVEDCAATGCLANASAFYPEGSWYEVGRTFTVPSDYKRAPDGSWYGPCVGSCEFPSYSWVGRIAGGADASFSGQGTTPPQALVGRATLKMEDFLAASRRAAGMSGDGDKSVAAMLCTEQGQVMAGLDSAGSPVPLTSPNIWKMSDKWAEGADLNFVTEGAGQPKKSEGFILTSWSLHGFTGAYTSLDWQLRMVLAVPDTAFRDSVLYPLHPWIIVVSVCPVVMAIFAALRMVYIRVKKRYAKSRIAAAATNLRNNLDRSIKDVTVEEALEAFEREEAFDRLEQEELVDHRVGQRHRVSFVFSVSWLQAAKAKTNRGRQSAVTSFNQWFTNRPSLQKARQAEDKAKKRRGSMVSRFGSMLGFRNRLSAIQGGGARLSDRELAIAKEQLTKARVKVRT